ncbi:hypothetical protein [Brevundimonas sp.]|uniref:hypothetical protein n=1 Tax=Brevundimonas sp. TaxID=1871086 RepID=UPI001DCDDC93|nr:hypothetical protein [Brevundimonas sp.]MBA4000056.1 hypothetical protein [Brevundimonas sp.]
MTGNQRTFTRREKRVALTALVVAIAVVAAITLLNPRPYLGTYETGRGFDAPAGVMDARPIGAA